LAIFDQLTPALSQLLPRRTLTRVPHSISHPLALSEVLAELLFLGHRGALFRFDHQRLSNRGRTSPALSCSRSISPWASILRASTVASPIPAGWCSTASSAAWGLPPRIRCKPVLQFRRNAVPVDRELNGLFGAGRLDRTEFCGRRLFQTHDTPARE